MVKVPNDGRTAVERRSERELVVRRTFDAPIGLVFDAWTTPDLFKQWWAPKSSGVPLLSCEMDVRTGGHYRMVFGHDAAASSAFFGNYLDVTPPSRLVWSNDEGEDGSVTTVTFEDINGRTHMVLQDLYASKEALDQACAGMEGAAPEQFAQLDDLLVTLGRRS